MIIIKASKFISWFLKNCSNRDAKKKNQKLLVSIYYNMRLNFEFCQNLVKTRKPGELVFS